jgi:hypothetical protein
MRSEPKARSAEAEIASGALLRMGRSTKENPVEREEDVPHVDGRAEA